MQIKKILGTLDYGELAGNEEFVNTCENLMENLQKVKKALDKLLPLKAQYDKLCPASQIELDLTLAYMLNSLHWVHLRIQGIDPLQHPIKDELRRIKAAMIKWQEFKDQDKRPTVNIDVAKRFIKSGLYDRSHNDNPPNKKRRFNEDTEDE